MKSRPILFSAPMIKAILDGRKVQTRRIVRDARGQFWDHGGYRPDLDAEGRVYFIDADTNERAPLGDYAYRPHCPHGKPGDQLWCKETHLVVKSPRWEEPGVVTKGGGTVAYRASVSETFEERAPKWTPSIFMPRWASRITLEVTEVRVQRLQEISEDDARAEGCVSDVDALASLNHIRGAAACAAVPSKLRSARDEFRDLWDSINGKPRPMLDDDGNLVLDDNDRPIMVASRSWASNPWVWAMTFRRVP